MRDIVRNFIFYLEWTSLDSLVATSQLCKRVSVATEFYSHICTCWEGEIIRYNLTFILYFLATLFVLVNQRVSHSSLSKNLSVTSWFDLINYKSLKKIYIFYNINWSLSIGWFSSIFSCSINCLSFSDINPACQYLHSTTYTTLIW